MDNKILFQELIKEGLLSEELARKILQESYLIRRSAEDLLYDRRLVDGEMLAKVKSRLLKIPYKKLNVDEVSDELLKLIPEETARTYRVVPVSRSEDLLVVGMLNPDDLKAQEAVKFLAKQMRVNLGVYLISHSDWELILRRYSPYRSEIEMAIKSLNLSGKTANTAQKVVHLEEGNIVAEEAPVIKIIASTLKEAVWEKASDIHIEPQRNAVRIRFRLDGELKEVALMPPELHQPLVSRVKVLANLKLDETRIPQDGRFRTILLGRDIDFRVATFPTAVGEKVALRVLDPTVGLKGLEELGLLGRNLQLVKQGIAKPFGMVLITGPTGSGKTTTLYAIMQLLNKEDVNIVSLEDPVEYFIDGLNQSQVRPEIGYDFASGLRQILRQDPDVILVGEIRDTETAGLSVHAALTGHIVLSTLHTNNSLGVIPRLIDMKVEPFLLPSSLNLMVAQRLLPRLCEKCREAIEAPPEISAVIKREIDFLPQEALADLKERVDNINGPYIIYRSRGCDGCRGKGVVGRLAIFEVLTMTRELEDIIVHEPTEAKILAEARRQGIISLRQDGIIKALSGFFSIEEVLKETTEL